MISRQFGENRSIIRTYWSISLGLGTDPSTSQIDYNAKSNQYTGLRLRVGQQTNLRLLDGLGPPAFNSLPLSIPSIDASENSLPGHGIARNIIPTSEIISYVSYDQASSHHPSVRSASMQRQWVYDHRLKRESDRTNVFGISDDVWRTTSEEAWHRSFDYGSASLASDRSQKTSTGSEDTSSATSAPLMLSSKRAMKAAIRAERILRKTLSKRQERQRQSRPKMGGVQDTGSKVTPARESGYITADSSVDR